MWNIQLKDYPTLLSPNNFAGLQMLETHIERIYNSIRGITEEDYKKLNHQVERRIVEYCNGMTATAIELYVYNYGFDNAIPLLHNYNRVHKQYMNTSSKSLLFAIIYSRFSIYYIYDIRKQTTQIERHMTTRFYHSILTIQRFWRRVLKHKKEVIDTEITYLLVKINKEIIGESAKKVLTYIVNKFRRRVSKTLRL